jgi:transcriptional regulator of arginine metabolism
MAKVARQARIAALIRDERIRTQAELMERLRGIGIHVTQPTLSKDLTELGAVRLRDDEGMAYAVPSEDRLASNQRRRLERLAAELVEGVEGFGNFTVIKTSPGAAQLLASALDHTPSRTIAGTIAGDDTVLVIHREADAGRPFAAEFDVYLETEELDD